jgi:hypothetical protein
VQGVFVGVGVEANGASLPEVSGLGAAEAGDVAAIPTRANAAPTTNSENIINIV